MEPGVSGVGSKGGIGSGGAIGRGWVNLAEPEADEQGRLPKASGVNRRKTNALDSFRNPRRREG